MSYDCVTCVTNSHWLFDTILEVNETTCSFLYSLDGSMADSGMEMRRDSLDSHEQRELATSVPISMPTFSRLHHEKLGSDEEVSWGGGLYLLCRCSYMSVAC